LAKIPTVLHPHINSALADNAVCLVATVLDNGYAQVSPRGSTMVFDDEHLAIWARGGGTTVTDLKDGDKVTVFFRNNALRESKVLPIGGVARFYGTAAVHKSGATYEEIWKRLIPAEKQWDPERKGFAVLIKVERAEDLIGKPLKLE
jgi:uncharacterized protein